MHLTLPSFQIGHDFPSMDLYSQLHPPGVSYSCPFPRAFFHSLPWPAYLRGLSQQYRPLSIRQFKFPTRHFP